MAAYTRKTDDTSKFRLLKKKLGGALKGVSDAVFSKGLITKKQALKDNIHGIEAILKQNEVLREAAVAYVNATEKMQILTSQVARRAGATNIFPEESLEIIASAHHDRIEEVKKHSERIIQSHTELNKHLQCLKQGETMFRDLRNLMTTREAKAAVVESFSNNKHRDRATKKLMVAQQEHQRRARECKRFERLTQLHIDSAHISVCKMLVTSMTTAIEERAVQSHATLDRAKDVSDHIQAFEQGLSSVMIRLDDRREAIATQEEAHARMGSLTGKNSTYTTFQERCRGLVRPPAPQMLPGEGMLVRLDDALYLPVTGEEMQDSTSQIPGSFVVTSYRLIFLPYLSPEEQCSPLSMYDEQSEEQIKKTQSEVFTMWDSTRGSSATRYSSVISLNSDIPYPVLKERLRESQNSQKTVTSCDHKRASILDDVQGSSMFQVPYGGLSRVEILDEEHGSLGLWTERLEAYVVSFQHCKQITTLDQVVHKIKTMSFGGYLFASDYRLPKDLNVGWSIYVPSIEYSRLGFDRSSAWRISNLNRTYKLCPTYPSLLVFPREMNDEAIVEAAAYRKKGRLPACVWRLGAVRKVYSQGAADCVFDKLGDQANEVTIMRSAQPKQMKSNTSGGRGSADVKITECLAWTSCIKNERDGRMCDIFDARPWANSMANVALGGGVEQERIYKNCHVRFLDIQNIHAVRESWVRLNGIFSTAQTRNMSYEVTQSYAEGKIRNGLRSEWLLHVASVLAGARAIVDSVIQGQSALIHCSDGWDRTSQLSALSQLLLDPYYRTLKGFEVLVEKEWCSFGHMFASRTGQNSDENYLDKHRSPIFVQFLDAVWQILAQFPNAFEFHAKLLGVLYFHVYSCRYGTFLYNSEKERQENNVYENTVSIWSDINSEESEFTNTDYVPVNGELSSDLVDEAQLLKLWPAYLDVRSSGGLTRTESKKALLSSNLSLNSLYGTV
jgi:myotubularin-related protein 1/2